MEQTPKRLGTRFVLVEQAYPAGDVREIVFAEDVRRAFLPEVSVYLEGEFETRNEAGDLQTPRSRGVVSSELPDVAAGKYTMKALTAGRSICIRSRDRKALKHQVIRVTAGQRITVPKGKSYLHCLGVVEFGGSYQPEFAFITADTATLQGHAHGEVVGLILWGHDV